jgi:aryl-alcohol dehydrogenase-like predicted oxidoreductase
MEYRQLGSSGLEVSALTLGTMTFGGAGKHGDTGSTDVAGARRQLDMCLDAGVNLIDTADVYSGGRSEEILGEALAGRRDRLLIATKVRFPTGTEPNMAGLSRHHIISGCEASLRRLGIDHIDLYQAHQWDGRTRLQETLGAFEHLIQSGKVRYVGASNYAGWQLMKAVGVAERERLPRFASHQIYYSLLERSVEYELIPLGLDQGIGTLVWSPLAGGWMSGKYRRGLEAPAGSRHTTNWSEPPVYDEAKLYDTIDVLVEIASEHGVSGAQVALAWLLARPSISSLVIGARTDQQLADNLKSVDLQLCDAEHQRLEEVSRPPLPYPYWHQCRMASDRTSPVNLSLFAPYLG